MKNFLVPIRNRIVKVLRMGSNQGKVDKLNTLTKNLSQNTELIAVKYKELLGIEKDVNDNLEKIQKEDFKTEIEEIGKLHLLHEKEQEKFTNSLTVIREQAIEELSPIGEQAQRIKAHMLVTLNKANTQKIILLAKSKLASNASLQLETLKTVAKQTVNVNNDLKKLLEELDEFNKTALNTNTNLRKNVTNMVADSVQDGEHVIDHLMNKIQTQE